MKKILITILMVFFFIIPVGAIDKASTDIEYYKANVSSLRYDEIIDILLQDFWGFYYDVAQRYDTELKREMYTESAEYAKRIEILKALRSLVRSTRFAIEIEGELSDYDLETNAFYLRFGDNYVIIPFIGIGKAPYSYNKFYLRHLPLNVVRDTETAELYGVPENDEYYLYYNRLRIDIAKRDALDIEEKKSLYKVIVEVDVIGTKELAVTFFASGKWYGVKSDVILTDNANMIVKNTETGDIVYNQSFSIPK